jgi:hypothetical protein
MSPDLDSAMARRTAALAASSLALGTVSMAAELPVAVVGLVRPRLAHDDTMAGTRHASTSAMMLDRDSARVRERAFKAGCRRFIERSPYSSMNARSICA